MESMEEILSRHRKEQRDLQSQITQKKKSGTKKTRKGVNDECARLEQELKQRQNQEIAQLDRSTKGENDSANQTETFQGSESDLVDAIVAETSLERETQNLSIQEPAGNLEAASDASSVNLPQQHRKPNRQKARLARRAAEQEAAAASAAEEAASMPDLREKERDLMMQHLSKLGLREKEIEANGHCLYSAVADQMRQLGLDLNQDCKDDNISRQNGVAKSDAVQPNDYKIVRSVAAEYISSHPDDFVPFLEERLDSYLHKIRNTGEWGGQLELMALAQAYGIEINILQSESKLEKIESNKGESRGEAWLAYYRHGFGLGEHYNSLRKVQYANTTTE